MTNNFCVLVFICCCLFVIAAANDRRIVALGDLHGDLKNTLEILKFSKLINDDLHWIGGDAIFVQTGDVVDRGHDTIELYDLIQKLRDEAPEQGGLVIPLLGNHEIMNLVGDWRYVYPGELQTFGSIENRKQAFHHTGFIGSYLTLLNMTTRVGSTVFCHGGITPHFSKNGIDWINDITHDSIIPYMESNGRQGDKYGVFGGEGPTWYRRYALDDEAVICDVLDQALELLEANRMVVGHTVQHDGEIHTRCGGKMILIDIGISNVYGGNKGSLEIRGNDVYALYADRIESLPSPPPYVPKDKREQLVHEEL